MKWFRDLPLTTQYYYLQLFNLSGVLVWIWLAMAKGGGVVCYLISAWCFISVCSYMKKEKDLYHDTSHV